jgi:hypothetical protein
VTQTFAQRGDSLADDEHTSWPRTITTELKIQEFVMLVHANHSQMLDEVTAAAGISHGTCHKILFDDLNMCCVTQHNNPCILKQDQCDDLMNTYGGDLSIVLKKMGCFSTGS